MKVHQVVGIVLVAVGLAVGSLLTTRRRAAPCRAPEAEGRCGNRARRVETNGNAQVAF